MIVIHEIRLNTSEHSIEYPNEEYEIVLHQFKRRDVPYYESLISDGFDGYPGTDKLKTLYWNWNQMNQISVYIRSCDKDNFDVIIRLYNDIDDYKKHVIKQVRLVGDNARNLVKHLNEVIDSGKKTVDEEAIMQCLNFAEFAKKKGGCK